MNTIHTDQYTVALAVTAVALYIASKARQATSLVHPILLGRQSDVERVRKPGESAIYRNYGTGLTGRMVIRPEAGVLLLSDLIKNEHPDRTLWGTRISNAELKEMVAVCGAGIVQVAGLAPKTSSVMLLLNDSLEYLVADLALASHSVPSVSVAQLSLLGTVLENHPPAAIIIAHSLLGDMLELLGPHPHVDVTLVVVGDPNNRSKTWAPKTHVKIFTWEEVLEAGKKAKGSVVAPAAQPSDLFSITFFKGLEGTMEGVQLTHENITAGVASTRAIFPYAQPITPSDSILSAHPLYTPFGRVLAYTALWEGTSFSTLNSTQLLQQEPQDLAEIVRASEGSPPTLLFITPSHLQSITTAVMNQAQSYFLFSFAWRHKLADLLAGHLAKDTFWDKWVFNDARTKALGQLPSTLRAVCVAGGPFPANELTRSRLALSVPIVFTHIHSLVAGAVFSSHTHDLQTFPVFVEDHLANVVHVGPPSANVEVKLLDLIDIDVDQGKPMFGTVAVRGPIVCEPVPTLARGKELPDGWIRTGDAAVARTNGTFKASSPWTQEPTGK